MLFLFLWFELLLPSQLFPFLGSCNLPITGSPISAPFRSNPPPENAYACYSFPQPLQKSERNLVFCSLLALCNFISSLNMSLLFYVRPLPNKITFGCRSYPSLSQGSVREYSGSGPTNSHSCLHLKLHYADSWWNLGQWSTGKRPNVCPRIPLLLGGISLLLSQDLPECSTRQLRYCSNSAQPIMGTREVSVAHQPQKRGVWFPGVHYKKAKTCWLALGCSLGAKKALNIFLSTLWG